MLGNHLRVAAVLSLAALPALATAQGKIYVSASAGISQADGDYVNQVRGAGEPRPGFVFVSAGRHGGSDGGGRLALGYRLFDGFAIELGYANFGQHGTRYQFEKTTGLIPAQRFVTSAGAFKLDGVTLDAVGTLPINAAFSANARVGLIATNLRYNELQEYLNQGVTSFAQTERQTRLHWGVGATYQVNKALGVTLDYTRAESVGKGFAWTAETNGRLSYGLFAAGVRYSF